MNNSIKVMEVEKKIEWDKLELNQYYNEEALQEIRQLIYITLNHYVRKINRLYENEQKTKDEKINEFMSNEMDKILAKYNQKNWLDLEKSLNGKEDEQKKIREYLKNKRLEYTNEIEENIKKYNLERLENEKKELEHIEFLKSKKSNFISNIETNLTYDISLHKLNATLGIKHAKESIKSIKEELFLSISEDVKIFLEAGINRKKIKLRKKIADLKAIKEKKDSNYENTNQIISDIQKKEREFKEFNETLTSRLNHREIINDFLYSLDLNLNDLKHISSAKLSKYKKHREKPEIKEILKKIQEDDKLFKF